MDEHTNDPSESEIKKVEKMLGKVSKKEPKIRRMHKDRSAKERERLGIAISSVLSEYTDCYILLGFDTEGNSVVLINTASNLETRALSDLIKDFVSTRSSIFGGTLVEDRPDDYDGEDGEGEEL